jgi:hypothetical protein
MEGIVAKRLGSRYAPGQRTDAWVKIKVPGYAPERWADWIDRGGQRQKEPAGCLIERTTPPCPPGGPSRRSAP